MFGSRIKEQRKLKKIRLNHIAKELGVHTTSVWYFENREPESIDLYLSYLAKNGIDLNDAFLCEADNIAKCLKGKRQEKKISWQNIAESIGISQSSLSYLENRDDTPFINFLKFLATEGINLNVIFK